jgi:hypothetical protein
VGAPKGQLSGFGLIKLHDESQTRSACKAAGCVIGIIWLVGKRNAVEVDVLVKVGVGVTLGVGE